MLIEVGRRLRACVRPDDVVARLGGDEFVVLLVGSFDPEAAAERIVESLRVPLWIDGTMLRPSLSLGLASLNEDAVDASELLRRADIAMYAAKTAGKTGTCGSSRKINALVHRNELEAGLRLAVDSGQIAVHYQPIVSARLGSTSRSEALARWVRDGECPAASSSFRRGAQRPDCRDRHRGAAAGAAPKSSPGCGGPLPGPSPSTSPVCSCSMVTSPSWSWRSPNPAVWTAPAGRGGHGERLFRDDCHVIRYLAGAPEVPAPGWRWDDFGTGYSSLRQAPGPAGGHAENRSVLRRDDPYGRGRSCRSSRP